MDNEKQDEFGRSFQRLSKQFEDGLNVYLKELDLVPRADYEKLDRQWKEALKIAVEQADLASMAAARGLELKQALLHAYRDIDYLLQEGFDTNCKDCQISFVRDTIKEIEEFIDVSGHNYVYREKGVEHDTV